MNNNDFIVFDFETGGIDPEVCEPIQVAALAINARKLTPYPNATFSSMMRPPGEPSSWKIDPKALEVNKKTMEQIEAAPAQEEVWRNFAAFVNRYNPKGTVWSAPIPCGQNIKGFDLIIADRLCKKYGIVDKDRKPTLFNKRNQIDLVDISFLWFENQVEPVNHKLDTLRDYFGISKEGAHDALVDVQQTADIILRFLKLHRKLAPSIPFKGAFSREDNTGPDMGE